MSETRLSGSGIRFDPTINLGHLLTFAGFVVAIFVSWANLDKRIVVLEESRETQHQIDKAQDAMLAERMRHIQESLNDLRSGMQRLNDRLERITSQPRQP